MQMHITGSVTVRITVSNGTITDVEAVSGPPMLASAAVRHVKSTWVATPGTSGTYTLPLEFVMH
jgi:hypothetical protein